MTRPLSRAESAACAARSGQAPEPSLRQFRALMAVAETGSFRRAADRVGIAQPSLSAQIQGLEQALGCTLVERGGRGATLTPDGREADRRAREIIEAVAGLRNAMAGGRSGTLRLGVTSTIGPYLVPRAVSALRRRGADLRLSVREAPPRTLARELSEGTHDVILTHLPVNASELEAQELFRERLLLVLPRTHALSCAPSVKREDLSGLEVLSLDARFQLHDQVTALCESFGARFQADYEGSSLDALREMTALGLGVTFLPELYVRSEIRPDSDVVAREIAGRTVTRSMGLAWRRASGRRTAVEALATLLTTTFRELIASR